jgi:iron complex transport system permease protein
MNKTLFTRLIVLVASSLLILVVAPFLGMDCFWPSQIQNDSTTATIFFSLRIPRVLIAFMAGGGLALCGMTFQALFRNPLADPYILGVASGASCGAAATILLGITGVAMGVTPTMVGSFCGALLAMAFVHAVARIQRYSSGVTLLLAGIAVSFFFSSVLMLLQYLSSIRDSFQIVRWLMGGIDVFGMSNVWGLLPFLISGSIIIFFNLPHLDHLLAGEDAARTRGVNVSVTRTMLLIATTLIVGAIVAVCGPIGFVGLMVPHVCRRIFSTRHIILAPTCFVMGGVFLVICDLAARTIIAPVEMPVGVITALTGGPFFIYILLQTEKNANS